MNILIADDHALFRDTLSHYIQRAQPDYSLQMVSNLNEVVAILNEGKFLPDLCILDFRMPGMKGQESFARLIDSYPNQSFAVMSGVAETKDIETIISTGVSGFLPKTLPGRVLLKAIDDMLNGEKFIPYDPDKATTPMSCYSMERPEKRKHVALTSREKDVLKLLCEGLSNREIADSLDLKIVTVKLHMRSIFKKLDCDNRTRVVLRAREWKVLG